MEAVKETYQDIDEKAKADKPSLEKQLHDLEMEQKQMEQSYHQITGAIAILRKLIQDQKDFE